MQKNSKNKNIIEQPFLQDIKIFLAKNRKKYPNMSVD